MFTARWGNTTLFRSVGPCQEMVHPSPRAAACCSHDTHHTLTRPGLNLSLSSATKCSCCFICVSAYKYRKAKKIVKPLNADKLSHLERNLCSRNLNKPLCKVFVIQPLLNSYARKSIVLKYVFIPCRQ